MDAWLADTKRVAVVFRGRGGGEPASAGVALLAEGFEPPVRATWHDLANVQTPGASRLPADSSELPLADSIPALVAG